MRAAWLCTPRIWLGMICLLQVIFALYYFPLEGISQNMPYGQRDYGFHFYNAYAATNFERSSQQLWGYDPFFLAGYPSNVLDNLDNRLIEMGVVALNFMGEPRAFNLIVLAFYVGAPLCGYATARTLGLTAWTGVATAALAVVIFQFESFAHSMWRTGAISFLTSAYLAPLVIALFAKYIDQPARWSWVWFALSLVLISILHGFAFFILLVPALVLYGIAARRMTPRQHVAIWASLGIVLLANIGWLVPSLRYLTYLNAQSMQLQGGWDAFLADLRGVVWQQPNGISSTAGLRWSITLLGILGVWKWQRQTKSPSARALGAGIVTLLGFAYLGTYVPGVSALETFRYVVPASFLACAPAARRLVNIPWREFLDVRNWRTHLSFASLGVLLVLSSLSGGRAVFANAPRLNSFVAQDPNYAMLPTNCQLRLFAWIRRNTRADARILVQDNRTGALLPYFVKREVIGGPYFQRQFEHNLANASFKKIFGTPISDLSNDLFEKYLDVFNVGWIVSDDGADPKGSLTNYYRTMSPEFMEYRTAICNLSVYRVTLEHSFFLQGTGTVKADYNVLRVTGASAGSVVLKYHVLDTLRTDPPLPLSKMLMLNDTIGFIQVENGDVSDFLIYNSYTP